MKGVKILGDTIYLDSVKISEAKSLSKYFNETRHFLGNHPRMSISKEKSFIKVKNLEEDMYFFGIRLKESGKIIGTISVFEINSIDGVAKTGTMLGEEYSNKGYGTEAKQMLLNWVFETLGLRIIYSEVYGFNERSRAYSLKCGYVQEASLSKKKFYNGEYWDELIFSITKKQWQSKLREKNTK